MKWSFIIRKIIENRSYVDIITVFAFPIVSLTLSVVSVFLTVAVSPWWAIVTLISGILAIIGFLFIDDVKRNTLNIYHIDFLEDNIVMKRENRRLRKKIRELEFKLYQKVI